MENHAVSRPLGSWACPLQVLPPLGLGIVPCTLPWCHCTPRSVAVLTGRFVPDVPVLAGSIDSADKSCQESALQTGGLYSMQSGHSLLEILCTASLLSHHFLISNPLGEAPAEGLAMGRHSHALTYNGSGRLLP